ncbi:beta-1,4-N-acetylglucosamine oligosaccharide 6-O-carbamoyltransferase NodU [Chitinophaga eiseniae]|uniref:Beta-1,4-N-acetylglucosamine oligosaccharide 6-O-carbamoyltransferase NodU n=1 Tax=Chitinophaga eiseniae TaxID=634771 RepID=A0A1T4U1Z0_9BACT|nr:carbamoyltransferase N-terminal domain-containing protein [Chitinophaga eiseniae]SKA46683.1 beta-1,4-N-acetylglucosamine oligosaccharide 6-O-carbamoyltransferase NodU [Chitinophaga eiseniae]
MKILGIKTSHDGALALIDNGKLIFSYEMEKLNNNNRIEVFNLTMPEVETILNNYGYSLRTMDVVAIDGWRNDKKVVMQSEREEEFSITKDAKLGENFTVDLKLAKYGILVNETEDVLKPVEATVEAVGMSYSSYMHVTGHLYCAYCTSPFAKGKQDSYVLVWDGGMPPQLFFYQGSDGKVINCGPLFLMLGAVYPEFSFEFEPFDKIKGDDQASGKLMAYIALGKVNDSLLQYFNALYTELEAAVGQDITVRNVNWITRQFIARSKEHFPATGISNEDLLCTFHVFLESLLIERLTARVRTLSYPTENLCFVGGCALSIKWNSRIRDTQLFRNMWVPPFPNDSGSAIGTACSAMANKSGHTVLDWDVYAGPGVAVSPALKDSYAVRPFSVAQLAALLAEKNEPVVVLNGRAELGPRALGNRSIISAATHPRMKDLLNKVKGREFYRPVAPICLESGAPEVFTPGTPDPYMLFEHIVKDDWRDKVPAIAHLDGSARLQTVNENENAMIYELLTRYHELTGVPLLCNTSANFKGKGFFPDVQSVMEWDHVNYIWSDNILYERKEKLSLPEPLEGSKAVPALY